MREYSYSNDTGDCSISIQNDTWKMFQLPLKHYHGITIGIDLDKIEQPLISYLEICSCSPHDAVHHICGGMSHIVLRSSEIAKKFFEELYQVDAVQRLNYLKIKIPELFYHMKYANTARSYYDRSLVPRSQVEIVKAVSEYITQNLNEKNHVKTADLEKVAACEPDVIFIGGRLASIQADLEAIAPVIRLAVDYEKGVVESTKSNTQTIASIFGKEADVDAIFDGFKPRIDTLNSILKGKMFY